VASTLTAQPVAAQAPGSTDPLPDGVAFELDGNATAEAMSAFAASVTGEAIHQCVADITTSGPEQYRVMGTPTHRMFLDSRLGVFEDLGLVSGIQEFSEGGPGVGVTVPTGGRNLIAVLPGADLTKWVVIGGHYDTREATVGGGALDNTSGICTVLELARAMKATSDAGTIPNHASVVFAWYDGEEWGLWGARALAADMSVPRGLLGLDLNATITVLASLSFDMPGLNYPAKNNWVQYGEPTAVDEVAVLNLRTAPIHDENDWACFSYGCYQDLKGRDDYKAILRNNTHYQYLVREVAYDLLRLPPEYVWVYDDNYGRSDHVPLIAMGSPGMRIQGSHDEEYPHYHQPTDSLPALEVEAGGKDLLIAGYETEARVGGTVAYYIAKTGGVGGYGYRFSPAFATNGTETAGSDTAPASIPAPSVPVVLLPLAAALLVALMARRRKA
jgi:hypothetical protein